LTPRHARGHRDGQHRADRVPSATAVSWVGDLGEAVEQVMALVGCQRGGRGQPLGNSRDGRDEQAGTVSGGSWALTPTCSPEAVPASSSTRPTHPTITNQTNQHFAEALPPRRRDCAQAGSPACPGGGLAGRRRPPTRSVSVSTWSRSPGHEIRSQLPPLDSPESSQAHSHLQLRTAGLPSNPAEPDGDRRGDCAS
jgi:hypothetical protein